MTELVDIIRKQKIHNSKVEITTNLTVIYVSWLEQIITLQSYSIFAKILCMIKQSTINNMESGEQPATENNIKKMFQAGAHLGYNHARRNPSVIPYILTTKNKTDIINLEKTILLLDKVTQFVKKVREENKQIIFVGTKPEAKMIIKNAAIELGMPYVIERWIGGSITNWSEIKKRIEKLIDLKDKKQKGELEKYTKKERLMIDREIDKLEKYFGGMINMKKVPDIMFVIDSKHEAIAIKEAKINKVPVISLSSTDCNIREVDYPIVGNDNARSSIQYFVDEITKAYKM